MLCRIGSRFLHNTLSETPDDLLDGGVYMRKECLPAAAKIIQSRLTVRRFDKTVLGAFAKAGELVFTPATIFRKKPFLCLAEPFLML